MCSSLINSILAEQPNIGNAITLVPSMVKNRNSDCTSEASTGGFNPGKVRWPFQGVQALRSVSRMRFMSLSYHKPKVSLSSRVLHTRKRYRFHTSCWSYSLGHSIDLYLRTCDHSLLRSNHPVGHHSNWYSHG